MITLAQVLEFKFPGVQGIRTRQTSDGKMEIFDWPMGSTPSSEDIAAWKAEMESLPPEVHPIDAANTLNELKAAMKKLGWY